MLLLPALISAQCMEKWLEVTSFMSVEETLALQGRPVACGWQVGENHLEAACWLHCEPMRRP